MNKNRRANKNKTKVTKYGEFLVLLPCCIEAHRNELFEKLMEAKRPEFINGKETITSLNAITYGQLDDLSRITEDQDPAVSVFKILLGIDPTEVYEMNVVDVFGFVNFVRDELTRINKLFAAIAPTHSSEEIAAGVKQLNFGTFGIIDWYARRMGITNQDEVYSVAWIRIYTCMKNDNEQAEYEKRLNKQYINKHKARSNGKYRT